MKVAVAAIFKNEFPYVLEWIAHHRLLGIEHFYIADNVSNDGTSELLESLDTAGIITRIHFPRVDGISPQKSAYNYILNTYKNDCDLMVFIDADEFICCDGDFIDYMNLFNESEFGAMALNWKLFGSNDHYFPDDRLVCERFTKRSSIKENNNRHIKSIVKPKHVKEMNIHNCILESAEYCDSQLNECMFDSSNARTLVTNWTGLHVKHYVVKSRIEQFINKMNKGSAAGSEKRKKGISYFEAHDLNDYSEKLDDALISNLKYQVECIKKVLVSDFNFMSLGKGTVNVDINGGVIRGWAVCEDGRPPKRIKLVVDEKEFIVPVNRSRRDVYDKGLSKDIICGFYYELGVNSSFSNIEAFIFGSVQGLNVK